MPIDTSIYQSLIKPKSVGDFQAEYDQRQLSQQALQQNALGLQQSRMKMDEYGRSVKEQETVRNALAGASTDEARVNALYGTGTQLGMSQADAIRKQMAERQKAKSEAAKTNAGLLKQYSGILVQSPTMQTFESLAAHYTQQTGENIDNIRAIVQQSNGDPEVIRKIGAALSMEADKLLPENRTVNAGNAQVSQSVDRLTGVPTQTGSVPILQSADSRATQGTAAARLKFDREKETADAARLALPTFDSASGSFVDPRTKTVTPAMGPDGKPIAGKASAATEDERKAAGWLAQADNAWKNMRAVGFTKDGKIADAAKTGLLDAWAAVPSMGATEGAANVLRTPARRQFIQASKSLSEALLRAATGAGVNEAEARQKVQELTPVFGEDDATTRQKMDAIPVYLKSLKDRAGRAAPGAYVPPAAPGSQQSVVVDY